MITDGAKTIYTVKDWIIQKNKIYENSNYILIDQNMEKFLLNYFIKDYKYFVKKRKKEIISKNHLFSRIKKMFLNSKKISFKEKSYQDYGIRSLFTYSYPIVRENNRKKHPFIKHKEIKALDDVSTKYYKEYKFINEIEFNFLKSVWQEYIDYLVDIAKNNKKFKLKNNIENF